MWVDPQEAMQRYRQYDDVGAGDGVGGPSWFSPGIKRLVIRSRSPGLSEVAIVTRWPA
jgi:hypothetical protein